MPTYVYGCDTCGHRFEAFQKFSDTPLTTCPNCGAKIRRIFQPAGIVFKGSGWYSTDSRSGSSRTSDTSTSSSTDTTTKDAATKDTSTKTTDTAASSTPAAASTSSSSDTTSS